MKMNLIFASVILSSFLVTFHATAAGPKIVDVDCDKGKSINDKVSSLDADKEYIVQISGTCTENVKVENFEGVSLQLVGNPTATINDASGTPMPVVSVTDSRRVTISGLTINGPIRMTNCRNCFFLNNTVNSTSTGIVFFQSQGVMQGNKVYITFTPPLSPVGVGVSALSDLGMFGNEIHGLGGPVGVGVSVTLTSQVRMSGVPGPAVIDGFTTGLQIRDGSGLLSGGALQCGSPLTACISVSNNVIGARITSAHAILGGMTLNGNGQGVFVEQGSSVNVGPTSAVTNSTSLGVFATHNSTLVVGSNASITNNANRGVAVGTNSSALLAPPGLNISGQVKNVTCDATSIVTSANSYPGGPPPLADCPNQSITPQPVP